MIVQILFERGYVMALSDETLEQIVSNLTPEEREQLFSQLGRQIEQDKSDIANGKEPLSPPTKPKQKKIITNRYKGILLDGTVRQRGVIGNNSDYFTCVEICSKI